MNAFAQKNKSYLIEQYTVEGKSTYAIGKALNVNAKKVQRALQSLGVDLRGYKEAQQLAIKKGRAKHPTKGKKMSASSKEKMSRSIAKYWNQMSDKEKQRRSDMSKQQWEEMSDEQRRDLYTKAAEGCRKAAKEGSKLEKFIKDELIKRGYNVSFHEKTIVRNTQLEVDLFLPDLNTAIEIDGISHFEPIWGDKALKKQQQADTVKSGLILSSGFVMLRIKQICKTASNAKMYDTLDAVLKELKKIENDFPKEGKRYIEVEVQ